MAKLRLTLDAVTNREIVMKDIINVIIDGVDYRKSDYTNGHSRVLQNFYMFVKRHKEKITTICYKHHGSDDYLCFIYLKDGKLHSLTDYAICDVMLGNSYKQGNYFVDGERLDFIEWQKKIRKYKLENLKK